MSWVPTSHPYVYFWIRNLFVLKFDLISKRKFMLGDLATMEVKKSIIICRWSRILW